MTYDIYITFGDTIEDLRDKLENGTEEEKLDARLKIMGKLLYYEGD